MRRFASIGSFYKEVNTMVSDTAAAYFGGFAVPVSQGRKNAFCLVGGDGGEASTLLKTFFFSLLRNPNRESIQFLVYDGRGEISLALHEAGIPYVVLDPLTQCNPLLLEKAQRETKLRSLVRAYDLRKDENLVAWDLKRELRDNITDINFLINVIAEAIFQHLVSDPFDAGAVLMLKKILRLGLEEDSPFATLPDLVKLSEDPLALLELLRSVEKGYVSAPAMYALGRELTRYTPYFSAWAPERQAITLRSFTESGGILVLRPFPEHSVLSHYHRAFFRALCRYSLSIESRHTVMILDEADAILSDEELGTYGREVLANTRVPITTVTSLSSRSFSEKAWARRVFDEARYVGILKLAESEKLAELVLRLFAMKMAGVPTGSDRIPGEIGTYFSDLYQAMTLKNSDLPKGREDGIEGLFCLSANYFLHVATWEELSRVSDGSLSV